MFTSRIGVSTSAVLFIACLAACTRAPEPISTVVYSGALLIVGDGTVIENSAFSIDDGRFGVVGRAAEMSFPAGATHVDLSGMTVMPAIVDAHVHLGTTREALIEDLERRAYFGVGAALSMGSDLVDTPLALRDEVIPGAARNRSAGTGITRPEPGRREVHWVNNASEARQAVQQEHARNVDLIKVWVDDRDGQFDKLTPELYSAIIDEAHARDLRVSAHIYYLEDAKGLLEAGVDIFAHGIRDQEVDDDFLALVTARPDAVLIPNMPNRGVPTDLSWLAGAVTDATLASLQASEADPQAQAFFDIQARNLARLSEAGMIIALGTDGNTAWAPHVEMEDMVAAGMSPGDVIVAATRNSAAVLRLDDTGTIEAGNIADFIVLGANPLEDITNTRQIASVYLRGDEVDRAALRAKWSADSVN